MSLRERQLARMREVIDDAVHGDGHSVETSLQDLYRLGAEVVKACEKEAERPEPEEKDGTMFTIGTRIRSTWDRRKEGEVVGYGSLMWPRGTNMSGDGGVMHPAYLVQVAEGSNAKEVACIVLRADRVEAAP